MKKSRFCLAVTLLTLLLLYVPIGILMVNSFNASRFGGMWEGFSLKWYYTLFQQPMLWESLQNSLIVGITSTIASTVLGTIAAFALHFYRSKLQKAHSALIYVPLVVPDILMGISLLLFFFALNIKLCLLTVTIAHTTFCLSYVTMVMLAKLQNFNFSIVEAALDLGADMRVVVRRILLPLLLPGLFASALLAFTLSIDDFVITFFLAGEGVSTLPIYIYSMGKFGSTPIINALSTIILSVTFLSVFLFHTFSPTSEEQL